MKTVLIVDDDASALRALARLIAARHPGVEVLTATSGREAIALLEARPVDLALTDLQMPGLNGFELLVWMGQHVPSTRIIPMTAYLCEDTTQRLHALGSMECLTKPVDIDGLSQQLNELLASGIDGYVHNIGLPSLLQLLEIERKTCAVGVVGDRGAGTLHMLAGQLVHAETRELRGDDAALEMATWRDLKINLADRQAKVDRTVEKPLGFILMEAARMQDERRHSESKLMAAEESGFFRAVDLPLHFGEASDVADLVRHVLETLASGDGVKAAALVSREGVVLNAVGRSPPDQLGALANGSADLLAAELSAIDLQRSGEALDDMLITSAAQYELIKPLDNTGSFVLLLVERDAVPALVRMKVASVARRLVDIMRIQQPVKTSKDSIVF